MSDSHYNGCPKKPKRQRHWQSAKEIESEIDSEYRKIAQLSEEAQQALDDQEFCKGVDLVGYRKHGRKAGKLLGEIKRLKETRLPKLQMLLAEFQTIPLGEAAGVAGLDGKSVVLQSKA